MTVEINSGPYQIRGYAQEMADGTWAACCVISRHEGGRVLEELLPKDGPYYASKDDAEKAGLEKGVSLLNERYPLAP